MFVLANEERFKRLEFCLAINFQTIFKTVNLCLELSRNTFEKMFSTKWEKIAKGMHSSITLMLSNGLTGPAYR